MLKESGRWGRTSRYNSRDFFFRVSFATCSQALSWRKKTSVNYGRFVQLCQPQRCICWKYGLASMDWVHPSIFQWVTPFTSHQNQTLNFFWCGFAWGGAVSSFSVQLLLRFMFEYRHHFSSAVTTVLSLSKRSFLGINVVQAPMSYQQSRSVYVRPMSPICWYCAFPPSDAKIAV